MLADLANELAAVKAQQQRYLHRELTRIDTYFDQYGTELIERTARQKKEESRQRYEQRLNAARADHQRKRAEQIARHAIRVIPHLDSSLLVGEPAFRTRVHWTSGREPQSATALYVPRIRRWFQTIARDVLLPERE